jgi:hypothetical protein
VTEAQLLPDDRWRASALPTLASRDSSRDSPCVLFGFFASLVLVNFFRGAGISGPQRLQAVLVPVRSMVLEFQMVRIDADFHVTPVMQDHPKWDHPAREAPGHTMRRRFS